VTNVGVTTFVSAALPEPRPGRVAPGVVVHRRPVADSRLAALRNETHLPWTDCHVHEPVRHWIGDVMTMDVAHGATTELEGAWARDYPQMAAATGRIEPAPRRVRAVLDGRTVFDTTRARYVWEFPFYPQYYIPLEDVDGRLLVDEGHEQHLKLGTARRHGLRAGGQERPGSVRVFGADAPDGVAGTARFDWAALDAWYEEDEQVFVHPRNPYVRVDALRSHRHIRVALDGHLLADTATPILVFETGLLTRYYIDRTDVVFTELSRSRTQTACPYKGVTSDYWSLRVDGETPKEYQDIAWSYSFPTRQLQPIAGLVAFYNEKVGIELDGVLLPRPHTRFV
jgi:uncharacterized protein (DUF427 family)